MHQDTAIANKPGWHKHNRNGWTCYVSNRYQNHKHVKQTYKKKPWKTSYVIQTLNRSKLQVQTMEETTNPDCITSKLKCHCQIIIIIRNFQIKFNGQMIKNINQNPTSKSTNIQLKHCSIKFKKRKLTEN